jgi:hypothetical protein
VSQTPRSWSPRTLKVSDMSLEHLVHGSRMFRARAHDFLILVLLSSVGFRISLSGEDQVESWSIQLLNMSVFPVKCWVIRSVCLVKTRWWTDLSNYLVCMYSC